jgi:hypothetical protein
VPKAAAPDRGSVGEQIQREWRILREYVHAGQFVPPSVRAAIRKLDALIGYDDAK